MRYCTLPCRNNTEHVCAQKNLTPMRSSFFGVNGLQNETRMIRHKDTLPNHVMPCQPCPGLAWQRKARRASACMRGGGRC